MPSLSSAQQSCHHLTNNNAVAIKHTTKQSPYDAKKCCCHLTQHSCHTWCKDIAIASQCTTKLLPSDAQWSHCYLMHNEAITIWYTMKPSPSNAHQCCCRPKYNKAVAIWSTTKPSPSTHNNAVAIWCTMKPLPSDAIKPSHPMQSLNHHQAIALIAHTIQCTDHIIAVTIKQTHHHMHLALTTAPITKPLHHHHRLYPAPMSPPWVTSSTYGTATFAFIIDCIQHL